MPKNIKYKQLPISTNEFDLLLYELFEGSDGTVDGIDEVVDWEEFLIDYFDIEYNTFKQIVELLLPYGSIQESEINNEAFVTLSKIHRIIEKEDGYVELLMNTIVRGNYDKIEEKEVKEL